MEVNARPPVTSGIDWAEGHHDVALIDAEGRLVAKRRISDDIDGFTVLAEVLADTGDSLCEIPRSHLPLYMSYVDLKALSGGQHQVAKYTAVKHSVENMS